MDFFIVFSHMQTLRCIVHVHPPSSPLVLLSNILRGHNVSTRGQVYLKFSWSHHTDDPRKVGFHLTVSNW